MSTKQSGGDTVPDDESESRNQAVELLTTLVAAVVFVGWSLFWVNVAKVHYRMGDMLSAAFTATALVVPAGVVFGWYVANSHGFDVPTPDIDPTVIGS